MSNSQKIHVITMGFDTTERIIRTLDRFFVETDFTGLDLAYYVVDARYPFPNKAANMLNLAQHVCQSSLCDRYPVPLHLCILCRNAGQNGNYNELATRLEYGDDDILVFYDTDVRPSKPSWLKDSLAVMGNPLTAYVSMNCSVTDNAIQHMAGDHITIAGVPVRELTFPGGWPIGIWRGSFFRHGIPVTHEFYGGTEYNIQCAWRARGLKGYMMSEHDDLRDVEGIDDVYTSWKLSVIAVSGRQIDFETYLKERGLIL